MKEIIVKLKNKKGIRIMFSTIFVIISIIYIINLVRSTYIGAYKDLSEHFIRIRFVNAYWEFITFILIQIIAVIFAITSKKTTFKLMFSCFFVCTLLIGFLIAIGLFFEFDDITKKYSISNNESLVAVGWSISNNNNTRDFTTLIKYRKRIFPGIYCEKEIFRIDSDEFNPNRTEKLDYKGYIEIPFKEYYERIKDEDFSNCGKNLPFVQEYSEYNGWYFD